MKRLMAMVLAFCLCWMVVAGPVVAHADTDETESFDLTFMNAFNYSISKWYATGEMRALLTMLLLCDYCLATNEDSSDYSIWDSYVAHDSDLLYVVVHKETTCQELFLFYMPCLPTAFAFFTDSDDASSLRTLIVETALQETSDEWSKNKSSDLQTVGEALADALQ